MNYFLFLLVSLTLFLRPAEVVASLAEYQIYYCLIVVALLANSAGVARSLSPDVVAADPIVLCALGVFAAGVASLALRLETAAAQSFAVEFAKVLLFFLLLLAVLDTPARLASYLNWLIVFIGVMISLAVLGYHDIIELPAQSFVPETRFDPETGLPVVYRRLQATGFFMDPNDTCLALGMGIVLCLAGLLDARRGSGRVLFVFPLALFIYAVKLTESRGGLLGVLFGVFALMRAKLGWKKSLLLFSPAVPVILLLAGGRQAGGFDPTAKGDTGQARIQLWADGFQCFRASPLIGVGVHNYATATNTGLVAHNSFVHAYTEMGFFGGMFFLGAFYFALAPLEKLFRSDVVIVDPELRRLHPTLTAVVAGYAGGLLSLSKDYDIPTYLALGLAAAFLRQVRTVPDRTQLGIDGAVGQRLLACGVAGVVVIYLTIRLTVRYGGSQ